MNLLSWIRGEMLYKFKFRGVKSVKLESVSHYLPLYIWVSINNTSSLSVGHYELCRDDIGDLPGSPEHL